MVGHHDPRSLKRLGQFAGQPSATGLVALDGALGRAASDLAVVGHEPLGSLDGLLFVRCAHQFKVGPKSGPQEMGSPRFQCNK